MEPIDIVSFCQLGSADQSPPFCEQALAIDVETPVTTLGTLTKRREDKLCGNKRELY